MFDLQNMKYEDFLNANTNYKNANKENYLNALNISVEEFNQIYFEEGQINLFVSVSLQNDIGKFNILVEENIQL